MANIPHKAPLTHNINFAHSNAQSLNAHVSDLQRVIQENNIHVLGISQSWLKPGMPPDLVEIPDFNLFRVDRLSIARGGVAIYVHKSILVKEACRSLQSPVYRKRPEFLFLELLLPNAKILCGSMYSPPHAGNWSDVEDAIFNCNNSYDFSIIMGNFNIDWHASTSTRATFAESLRCYHLEPLPFAPTHHQDENTHTTIDYICVSDVSKVTLFQQEFIPDISKHEVIMASISYEVPRFEFVTMTRRSYRNFDLNRLLLDLAAENWHRLHSSQNLDFKVKFLTDAVINCYDRHAPFQTFTPKRKPSPWFSSEIKNLISAHNNAWRAFKRGGGDVRRSRYKYLCNLVQTSIRNAKFQYYKTRL